MKLRSVVAPDENVVRDVEVLRVRAVGQDAHADILHDAALDRQATTALHVLEAGIERDVGVADRQPLEVGVVRRHHIEQPIGPVAVEDDLAVACGLDHNRPVRRSAFGQHVRPVEIQAQGIRIPEPVALVDAGMHKDHVARLDPGIGNHPPIPQVAAAVVRFIQTGEGGLLFGSIVTRRIDVKRAAVGKGLRLAPRANRDDLRRLAADAVRVGQKESALVFCSRLEVEDASREHVGRFVGPALAVAVDPLAVDA